MFFMTLALEKHALRVGGALPRSGPVRFCRWRAMVSLDDFQATCSRKQDTDKKDERYLAELILGGMLKKTRSNGGTGSNNAKMHMKLEENANAQ